MDSNQLFPIVEKISKEKVYNYQPGIPELKNKKELNEIIKMINEKNEKLIITEDTIQDYTGRNSILAQLKKISKELQSTKTKVHREAKNAYLDFDNEVDYLIGELNKSIDNLSQQVEIFQQRKYEEKVKKVKERFEELKSEFKDSFLDNDKKHHPKMLSYEMWFSKKKTNLSKKALTEDIKNYLSNQTEEYETYYDFSCENPTLEKLFIKAYDLDNNAPEAFKIAKQQKQEMDELYEIQQIKNAEEEKRKEEELKRLREENERYKQQSEQKIIPNMSEQDDNVVEKKTEKTYFAFVLNDLSEAKMVKKFCDDNNLNYVFNKLKND